MSSPHVAARLHGHGMIVLPFPAYRLERADGDRVLRIARGDRSEVVDLRAQAATDLAMVSAGTRAGAWRIETTDVACAWPEGFAIVPDPESMSPFLLLGPEGAMIWVNGPMESRRAKPIEKLCAPGQRVRTVAEASDASSARIDLDYEVQGEPYWQRRYAIDHEEGRMVVVSAQAPRRLEGVVGAAVDLVERTLERI